MKRLIVHDHFRPLLDDRSRYLVMMGGRGSGKSEFAARKILMRCFALLPGNDCRHTFLVMRKICKTLERSVIRVIRTLLAECDIVHEYNRTDHVIRFAGPNGMNEILFDGLDEPEKIKSIKGITSIWLEEATEFTQEDFLTLNMALREPFASYHQIMLTFNPLEAEAPWLKAAFFDPTNPPKDARVHISTIEHNPIDEVRKENQPILDALEHQDPTLYEMWRLGQWAMPKGQIYHWPSEDACPAKVDEVFFGLDFGYSVNPSALIRISRKGNELYLEELIYQSKLTNHDLGRLMRYYGVGEYDYVYADSAEPKSIDEICQMGFNLLPSEKGPDSVRAGIDFLKTQDIRIVRGSTNIIKEASSYKWKEDKDGRVLPEPVKFNDHALDAIRYAIVTHMKQVGAFVGVIAHDIRPD